MAELVARSIDWIEIAPIRVVANAESSAPPAAVFAVLADHERWPEWFPGLRKVTVLGAATGVGARRRVALRGATVDEEFIVWEPGNRWSFTGVAASPRFTKSLVEDCQLVAREAGGTTITYTMYLDPPAALRPVITAFTGRIAANTNRAMRHLAQRAAYPAQ
ncbi:MAG: hypothetical protein NVS3B21_30870 [Acidimicrobiales bacterium]